jgi:hypothetical protein
VVLGSLVTTRVGGNAFGRFELAELHRALSIVSVVFVALHVITTVIDSYVPTWAAVYLHPLYVELPSSRHCDRCRGD